MGFGYNAAVVIGRVTAVRPGQYGTTVVVHEDSNEKYPNTVACEFQSDKAKSYLTGVGPDDVVKVEGSVRSREWNEKLYTNFVAWRLERMTLPGASKFAGGGRQQHREERPGDDDIPF